MTSFTAGVNAWSVSAYDKHVESGTEEAVGLMRLEVRLRRRTLRDAKWLDGANMTSMEQVTDDLLNLAFHRAVDRVMLTEPLKDSFAPDLTLRVDWGSRNLAFERDGYTGL